MNENLFKRFKAALIDMDGVLYDSMPGHVRAWHRLMTELGVECTRDEFYLYEGMTGPATINLLFTRAFGKTCSEERCRELYEVKSRYFKELGEARKMPGAARMLGALKAGGIHRVLVTGSAQKSLLGKLGRDYPGIFGEDKKVTALDVRRGKPDPEPYLTGALKAGAEPKDCMVIENAPLGVRAGKAAGCFTIAVTTGPIPEEEFRKEGADMVFESMDKFADFLERQLAGFRLGEALEDIDADKIILLTEENVKEKANISLDFADEIIVIPAGEKSKDLNTLEGIWRRLVECGATRRSLLVNLGGGTVSDLGGFGASTFKRGIRFVNVPTTLLAVADAAIGGKTGINFMGLKNEIGSFAMPEKVVVIPSLTRTLPESEMKSGFAEIVKMALIGDEALYRRLVEGDALSDSALMEEAMLFAARKKEEIVAEDPREQGLRRVLNFGHTAGHAYEAYAAESGHPISHGEAVAHGIIAAMRKSEKEAGFSPELTAEYKERILDRYYQPLPFGDEARGRLEELMAHDKKNRGDGRINFILIERPGKALLI